MKTQSPSTTVGSYWTSGTKELLAVGFAAFVNLVGDLGAVRVNASRLDNWHWLNPIPHGNTLEALVHWEGRFLAVGNYGVMMTSTSRPLSPVTACVSRTGRFVDQRVPGRKGFSGGREPLVCSIII